MNAERLLQHFDRIAEAPDSVARLRRFILDLAVRGKLVEQDPNDEPASELLKRIQAEKSNLAKEGKIGVGKPPMPARPDELEFDLLPGWSAAKISQVIVELKTGPFGSSLHQSDYQNGGVPVINPASIKNQRLVPVEGMAVGQATLERLAAFKVGTTDIVMARRGEMGRCAVVTDREAGWLCGTGSLVLRLASCVSPRLMATIIGSPFVREYLGGSAVGATMQNLNQSILLNLVIGLPPLSEQYRIVAKVDELMALCDELEAAQSKREQRRERLVAASLRQLQDEEGLTPRRQGAKEEEAEQRTLGVLAPWREPVFFRDIPRLTTRPEHISALRRTILNLAVRGRLVPQHPCDEPASNLLRSGVAADRKDGPFQLPPTWLWATGREIAETRLGKMLDKAKNKGTPRRYLRGFNVRWFDFDLTDVLEMRFEDSELKEFALASGDVLICEGGESGRAAVWDEREADIYFQKAIHRVRFPKGVDPYFFVNALRESVDSNRLDEYCNGVTIKHLTGRGLSAFPVPIPPLAEQHRIVAKVDELMSICDQLEAQLTATQTDSRRLLEAVLHEALA
jgi:type I restriction enzyme, S subunit